MIQYDIFTPLKFVYLKNQNYIKKKLFTNHKKEMKNILFVQQRKQSDT